MCPGTAFASEALRNSQMRGKRGRRRSPVLSSPARPSAATHVGSARGEERRRPPPRGRRHRVCIHVTGLAFQEKTTVPSALPLGTGWPSEWPDSSEPAGRSRRPRLSRRRAAPWSGRLAAPRGVPSEAGRLSPACHRRAAHADAATAASRRVPWSGGQGLHLEARHPAARRRAVCAHVPALE